MTNYLFQLQEGRRCVIGVLANGAVHIDSEDGELTMTSVVTRLRACLAPTVDPEFVAGQCFAIAQLSGEHPQAARMISHELARIVVGNHPLPQRTKN